MYSSIYFAKKKIKENEMWAYPYRRLSTVAVVSSYGGYDIFYHRRLVHVLHLLLVSLFTLPIHIRFSLLTLSDNFGKLFALFIIEKTVFVFMILKKFFSCILQKK